jgi:hypothetical protein
MTPHESPLSRMVDDVANALQVAVLVAEHLQIAASATAQDAAALTRSLRRATDALQRLRVEGGVQ